jgi:hypothetical protein
MMRFLAFFILLPCVAAAAPTTEPATTQPLVESTIRRPTIDQAVRDGVTFLVKAQQKEGCWGTGLETRGLEIYHMVPGSHDAYRVATTALCVMALRESIAANVDVPGIKEAHEKGVKYLIEHGDARRDDGSLLYNVWAHTFALQALSDEMEHNKDPDPRLASAARQQLDRLERYQTYVGGWNYYDFAAQTQKPSLGATSFGTAAGLVALWEARQAGVTVPQRMIDLAIHRVEECRLPSGAYLYGSDYKYIPHIPANRARGAIGRAQPANFALWLWGSKKVAEKESIEGLELFFKEHAFLDMGRKRPWPHEAWYQTSGYYYYYDHYYAAKLLDRLNPTDRKRFAPQLAEHILPHQEPDGSWWDYAMWDYHKPYGTAFAVMTLLRCK